VVRADHRLRHLRHSHRKGTEMSNPVEEARKAVCNRVSANIYGRVEVFLRQAEEGNDANARYELLALLKFFPKGSTNG
jgi:hypothetical protein